MAQAPLELVDAFEELACEQGAGIAEAEVTPQTHGPGEPCGRGARPEVGVRGQRLDQAHPRQSADELGVHAGVAGELVEAAGVRRPQPDREGRRRAPRPGAHAALLCEPEATRRRSS
jgi:hypothetical protein